MIADILLRSTNYYNLVFGTFLENYNESALIQTTNIFFEPSKCLNYISLYLPDEYKVIHLKVQSLSRKETKISEIFYFT